MCLGEHGVVDDVLPGGRALVRFDDGSVREVSLAVPVVDGIDVVPGDRVMVSIGMVLEVDAGNTSGEGGTESPRRMEDIA